MSSPIDPGSSMCISLHIFPIFAPNNRLVDIIVYSGYSAVPLMKSSKSITAKLKFRNLILRGNRSRKNFPNGRLMEKKPPRKNQFSFLILWFQNSQNFLGHSTTHCHHLCDMHVKRAAQMPHSTWHVGFPLVLFWNIFRSIVRCWWKLWDSFPLNCMLFSRCLL